MRHQTYAKFLLTYASGKVVRVQVNKHEFAIGRHPESDVLLSCPNVSRSHVFIRVHDDHVEFRDLRPSRAGLLHNGMVQKLGKLRDGDTLMVGDNRLVLIDFLYVPDTADVIDISEDNRQSSNSVNYHLASLAGDTQDGIVHDTPDGLAQWASQLDVRALERDVRPPKPAPAHWMPNWLAYGLLLVAGVLIVIASIVILCLASRPGAH